MHACHEQPSRLRAGLGKMVAFLIRDLKIDLGYRLNFILQAGGILVTTCTFFLFSRMIGGENVPALQPYGGNYFAFVIIGIAFSDYLVSAATSFAADIREAQVVGTLEALLVTPTSLLTILLSSYLYTLLFTTARILLYFILGTTLFGLDLSLIRPGLLLLIFLLSMLPFFGLGLLSAAFIIIFKQGSPVSGLIAVSSGLLGGVLYPVSVLPPFLHPVANLLPVTHGLEAMRRVLLTGADLSAIQIQLFALLAFSVVFLAMGIASLYYGLKIAKQEGSLLQY